MKQDILALGLGVGAILLSAGQMQAQGTTRCADRDSVVQRLTESYGETRQSIGLASDRQVVEVYASADTGTWTITVTMANGMTCLVAAGQGYEQLDEELTPARLGSPV
ncbi:hypothetical protein [Aliiroseovarius sp. S253]|uniref:hypothetical protein n=1 Tax=Aliiroseovarius sp. S253 TaxID=3415133 RepID=UPI003C7C782A